MPFCEINVELGVNSPGELGDHESIMRRAREAITRASNPHMLENGSHSASPSPFFALSLEVSDTEVEIRVIPKTEEPATTPTRIARMLPGDTSITRQDAIVTLPADAHAILPLVYPTSTGSFDLAVIYFQEIDHHRPAISNGIGYKKI